MKFMFAYPQAGADGDLLDAGPVTGIASAAEAAGWHGLAFTDHPAPGAKWLQYGGHQTLDPFVALGNAAAVTSKLRLHTHLAVAPYRNPLLLAKNAATVDKLSDGRMILGLGAGYHKTEFFALGIDFEQRNALFEEALDVLPKHWSGEAFSHDGLTFSARDVIGRPKPVQEPIPIWVGGNSDISLRRVAEKAQGWMPLIGPKELSATVKTPVISSLEQLQTKIERLRELAGERADSLDILTPYLDMSIADPNADAGYHRDQLARLEDMGVSWVFLPGVGSNPAPQAVLEFLERMGKTYIDN